MASIADYVADTKNDPVTGYNGKGPWSWLYNSGYDQNGKPITADRIDPTGAQAAYQDYYNTLAANGYNSQFPDADMGQDFWAKPQVQQAWQDYQSAYGKANPGAPRGTEYSGAHYGDAADTGILDNPFISLLGDVVAAGTGNPELIPFLNGGIKYGQTGSIGQGLLSGAEAFGGTQLAGAAGFGSAPVSGDAASGAASDGGWFGSLGSGLKSIGSGISSGLSGLADSTGLTDLGNSIGLGGSTYAPGAIEATDLPSVASSAVTSTSPTLTGLLPGGGAAAPGGGSGGGFLNIGNSSGDFSQGLGSNLTNLSSAPTVTGVRPTDLGSGVQGDFSAGLQGGSDPTALSFTPPSLPTPASGGSSMFSTSNLLNSGLKGALAYGLQKNNSGGYGALQGASNAAAQQYQPFMQAGQAATGQLQNLYGLNGQAAANGAAQQWQNTPGYQFALNQGLNAIDAGAAQRGMLVSGNNQQAEQKYGTGLADQYYNNYIGQLQNQQAQGLNATGGYGQGITNAAGAYSAGKTQQANTSNSVTNGLLSSLFPTNSLSNNNSGLLSYLGY